MSKCEMVPYFSQKTLAGEIPNNIETDVKVSFTKYEVEYKSDRTVVVKVPREEWELVKSFRNQARGLLKELAEKNSVLADRLARCHSF